MQSILLKAKSLGFSDRQIAALVGSTEDEVRALRKKLGIVPSYRLMDTCAAVLSQPGLIEQFDEVALGLVTGADFS
jgi:hypothetical protein